MSASRVATRFIFDHYEVIPAENRVLFEYVMEYDGHPPERFRETLNLPWLKPGAWAAAPAKLLERVLGMTHLMLGLNYWKMDCPETLVLKEGALAPEQVTFWEIIYTKGMGEFYYKNKIDFRNLVHFVAESGKAPRPMARKPKKGCLVPIGGGKDSAVTVQLLREHDIAFDVFTMGTSHIQEAFMEVLAVPAYYVERQLDPLMIARSKAEEVYNGHVPVSLFYVMTSLLTAVLEGHRAVVFSNEKSANIGNVQYLGMEINHQWSKTLECELLVRSYIQSYITTSIDIFSLLRPLHEIEIMRRFVTYGKYFPLVSSCNRNFVISSTQPKAARGSYWCGQCPKCAFVFPLMAAFLPKDAVCEIFGKNLFADESLLPLFQELLGLQGIKPFECVGLPEEVLVAFFEAHARHEWDEDPIMKWVIDHALPDQGMINELKKELFAVGDLATLPESFRICFSS